MMIFVLTKQCISHKQGICHKCAALIYSKACCALTEACFAFLHHLMHMLRPRSEVWHEKIWHQQYGMEYGMENMAYKIRHVQDGMKIWVPASLHYLTNS